MGIDGDRVAKAERREIFSSLFFGQVRGEKKIGRCRHVQDVFRAEGREERAELAPDFRLQALITGQKPKARSLKPLKCRSTARTPTDAASAGSRRLPSSVCSQSRR